VARVLPDVAGFERELNYLVPPELAGEVRPGSIVRVPLRGRRVRAWVLAFPVEPPAGVSLRAIVGVSSWGPEPEILGLAAWAAWWWAGRRRSLLVSASPSKNVKSLPPAQGLPAAGDGFAVGSSRATGPLAPLATPPAGAPTPPAGAPTPPAGAPTPPAGLRSSAGAPTATARLVAPPARRAAQSGAALLAEIWPLPGTHVIRTPPNAGATELVAVAALRGPVLVLAPTAARAEAGRAALQARGLSVALLPDDWGQARAGAQVVIGSRGAAWGPCPGMASVVVLDAHEEAYVQERAPTWWAAEVVAERARRARVPCFWVSPCPTLEMLALATGVWSPPRVEERAGWAALQVVDRRHLDPRQGLFSHQVVSVLRDSSRRVVCVLNRKGRATLLACCACQELATCERCGSAVRASFGAQAVRAGGAATTPEELVGPGGPADVAAGSAGASSGRAGAGASLPAETVLECRRCGERRPQVCAKCGSTALRALRLGVSGVREQAEALAGRKVAEVTAGTRQMPDAPVLVGTEAVLYREAEVHKTGGASVVAFLDFDQDLLAPRYRAGEDALALLARASRLVAGRAGTVIVQTRSPAHPVLRAALLAEPERLTDSEAPVRKELRLPPYSALALLSGPGAGDLAASLRALALAVPAAQAGGASGSRWLELDDLGENRWLVRASSHEVLADALAAGRPKQRVKVQVGQVRL